MTKALISLPSLALITTLALSGCSLSIGGGSSSQAQSQETRVSADSGSSAGSAKGSASRILKRGSHITVVVEPRESKEA